MKKLFKLLGVILFAAFLNINVVDASTASASINKNTCDTVYTNYYLFLEAETVSYMANSPYTMKNTNIGKFTNNYYRTYFNSNNVGYGQVKLTRSTSTSSDGITSMSLRDFYNMYRNTVNSSNGRYTNGTKTYLIHSGWFAYTNGSWSTEHNNGLSTSALTTNQLINATMDATSEMTRLDTISYNNANPFSIQISRTKYTNITGTPVSIGNSEWYLHPAVYYVQYCDEDYDSTGTLALRYDGNASGVTNVPATQYFSVGGITYVSSKVPVRSGYKFLGWNTDRYATNGSSMFTAGSGVGSSFTLYAIWEPVDVGVYSVIYKPNTTDEVTNLPMSEAFFFGETAIISDTVPKRNGYTFLGWSTVSGATSIDSNYNAGSKYTDGKDLILYAVWKKNKSGNSEVLPDNPKTGVEDYILPAGGITLLSLVGLGVLKKKKSYLQF